MDRSDEVTRRQFLTRGVMGAGALAAGGFLLSACDDGTVAGSVSPSTGGSVAPSFPISVTHARGVTEIPEAPQRVAALGYNDQDAVLALGLVPVLTREWWGEQPGAVWPWAQDKLGGQVPEVATEISLEQVASVQPDLILAVYEAIDDQTYNKLSQIAPTVANPVGDYADYTAPWRDMALLIGESLGQEGQIQSLLDDIDARFAAAAEANAGFAGRSGLVAQMSGNKPAYYGPADRTFEFMGALGFEYPDEAGEVIGDEFWIQVSRERWDLFDVDTLVWLSYAEGETDSAVAQDDELYQQLAVAEDGRALFTSYEDSAAMAFSTVLSLPSAIDTVVPQLAAISQG